MAKSPAYARIKSDVLALLRAIPLGRVATFDAIGRHLDVMPRHVAYILAKLTETERELVPWHRAVAKGGAIGWGPNRDQHFARLVREGVPVSPAGVVQDLERTAIACFTATFTAIGRAPTPERDGRDTDQKPRNRSRGIKDRPLSTPRTGS